MAELTWRQQRNVDMGRSPYFNDVMFDAGYITEAEAQERGVSEEARQSRITPENIYGVDLSIDQNTGAQAADQGNVGMGFQEWMESQGIWEGYLRGDHPMAWDQFKLRPTSYGDAGLYADGGTGGASGGAMGGADAATVARNQEIANTFKDAFIGGLQEVGLDTETIDKLWTWAESRFTGDASFTAAQAMIEVYDQPAFKERFPAIDQMRIAGRRDVPTPYEYVQREKWLSGELKRYGMADLGANINTVITDTFVNGVGTAEIQERLAGAARVIFEAPDDVKQTFIDWYGPQGDAALMMTFLDPTDNWGGDWVEVKRNIETSEVGGLSSMILDSRVAKERARSIAALGLQQGAIWDKFATLKEQENLFIERAGETDLDLISHGSAAEFGVEGEEIGGEFLSGFELSDILERRRGTRAAEFAGGGGAMITGSSTGFGAANA